MSYIYEGQHQQDGETQRDVFRPFMHVNLLYIQYIYYLVKYQMLGIVCCSFAYLSRSIFSCVTDNED